MFNNEHYNKTEELSVRIERISHRGYFILIYTLQPDILKVYLVDYLDAEFNASEEFGDNYADLVGEAVEKIIRRTHLNKREAETVTIELQNKMLSIIKQFTAEKKVKEMSW